MIHIHYDENEGLVLPDGKIESYIEDLILTHANTTDDIHVAWASELMLLTMRVYLKKHSVNVEFIKVYAYSKHNKCEYHILIDENYLFETHDYFNDVHERMLMELCQWL